MRIAQGILLRDSSEKQCVFLVDDLASELDLEHRSIIIRHLLALKSQLFVTGIDFPNDSGWKLAESQKMFHVEHGKISEESQSTEALIC